MFIKYLGNDHPILSHNAIYEVFKQLPDGYLVVTSTGFAGVPSEYAEPVD